MACSPDRWVDLLCPVCRMPLQRRDSFRCDNDHAFDVSRAGYINLLLPNEKKSKHPGDDRVAARSRERFLDTGYYSEASRALADAVARLRPSSVLDIGCGTGYYLEGISNVCEGKTLWGVDISKEVIRIASGRSGGKVNYVVASAFRLPFGDNSFDVITSVFAPLSAIESARVLKGRGRLVVAEPGDQHLVELRRVLYETPKPRKRGPVDGFKLLAASSVMSRVHPSGAETLDLLRMTPYFWQIKDAENKVRSAKLDTVTVDVRVSVLCLA